MRVSAIPLLLFLFLFLSSLPALAADSTAIVDSSVTPDSSAADSALAKPATVSDTVIYAADVIEFLQADSLLFLTGKAELKSGKSRLTADTIRYHTRRRLLEAWGNPVLFDEGSVIAGERMSWDLEARKGKIHYGTARSQGDVYNGQAIARLPDESFIIRNGDFSTCDLDTAPHFYFFGSRMKILPRDKMVVKPLVLNIGDVPVGVLPYFVLPIKHGRQSGLLTPRWGEFSDNGNRASYLNNVGYYFALSDYTDLETKVDFKNGSGFFFREVYFNTLFNYSKRYWLSGSVDGRVNVTRSDDASSRNYGLHYNHNQNLLPDGSFTLRGAGEIVGNRNYYRESTLERQDYLKRELYSNMALTKSWREQGLSANIDFNYRENLDTRENNLTLPSFSFSSASRPVMPRAEGSEETPLDSLPYLQKINWGYNMSGVNLRDRKLQRRHAFFDTTQDTSSTLQTSSAMDMRHDFSFGLARNPKLGPVNLSPSFSFSSSWYFKQRDSLGIDTIRSTTYYNSTALDTLYSYDTSNAFNHREEYRIGLNFSAPLYGTSLLSLGSYKGFRHILTPTVGWSFSPELKGGERLVSARTTSTGNRDQEQMANLSLSNKFQIKWGGDSSAPDRIITLLDLDAGTGYNFMAENRYGNPVGRWNTIGTRASTHIYALNLSYSGSHTLYAADGRLLPLRKGAWTGRLPRLLGYSIDVSTGAALSGNFAGGELAAQPVGDVSAPPAMSPWNLNLTFSYGYSQSYLEAFDVFDTRSTFSLRDNLTLNFSPKWRLGYSSIYDFKNNELVDQSMDLTRDFHCWEAVFNWVMSGYRAGYYFRINVRELPDIKFEKRGGQYGGYAGSGFSFPQY